MDKCSKNYNNFSEQKIQLAQREFLALPKRKSSQGETIVTTQKQTD